VQAPDAVARPGEGRQKRSWEHESETGGRLSRTLHDESSEAAQSAHRASGVESHQAEDRRSQTVGCGSSRRGVGESRADVGRRPAGRSAARLGDPGWPRKTVGSGGESCLAGPRSSGRMKTGATQVVRSDVRSYPDSERGRGIKSGFCRWACIKQAAGCSRWSTRLRHREMQ